MTVRRHERYPIRIDSTATSRLPELCDELGLPSRRVLVTSPRVWRLHGDRLRSLSRSPILVPDGERAKHLGTVGRVFRRLLDAHVDRQTVVVVAGGGVLGDMVGFAAASFMRGVPLVQVPTTVVAQVDAAIGGKVGVNLEAGKNLVGAYYQPAAVLVDPSVLATLPVREFRAGLYEVIKYAIIADARLFARLERLSVDELRQLPAALTPLIAACCRIKARIVTQDERDQGARLSLNFGHTIGHALEAATEYRRLRHGEAVGHGMRAALDLSVARGLLAPAERDRAATLIARVGPLPPVADVPAATLFAAMRLDKKRASSRAFTFVLSAGLGRVTIASDVTAGEVRRCLGVFRRRQP